MAISRKRAPGVEDSKLSRVVSQIYDDINEVINAVNQGDSSEFKAETEGKSGDIRIAKNSAGAYFIEGKTDEGWIQNVNKLDITTITDSTGGTVADTIANTTGVANNGSDSDSVVKVTEFENAIASISSKMNDIINSTVGYKFREKE